MAVVVVSADNQTPNHFDRPARPEVSMALPIAVHSAVAAALLIGGALLVIPDPPAATHHGRPPFLPVALASAAASDSSPVLPLAPTRLVTFTTTEGTAIALDVSPGGRQLAFDLLGDLYVLPITGGTARRLTEGPAFDEQPRYTPDGRFIVFSSDRSGMIRLWRMAIAGKGAPHLLPNADTVRYPLAREVDQAGHARSDRVPAVRSPDGRYTIRTSRRATRIVASYPVESAHRSCSDTAPAYLLLTDHRTGQESRLATAGHDCIVEALLPSAFTPDSRAFITSFGGKLWRIAVPSGRTTPIPFRAEVRQRIRPLVRFPHRLSEDSLVRVRRVAWARTSPDGRQLVFSALDRLWRMPLPQGTPRRLTTLDVGEFYPAWSPDGRYLAFVTWTDHGQGEGAIYRVRADGTAPPERLTREPGFYSHLQYTPDGSRLLTVIRPVRALHRLLTNIDAEMTNTGLGEAELAWLPAEGGVASPLAMLPAPPRFMGVSNHWFLGVPHFVQSEAGHVLQFEATGVGGVLLKRRLRTPLVLSLTRVDTVLTVRVASTPYSTRWRSRSGRTIAEVVLGPAGDRAVLVLDSRDLYLVDVPRGGPGRAPVLIFDPASLQARRLTPPGGGGEFVAWLDQGRRLVYSFGRTVYFHDVERSDALRRDSVANDARGVRFAQRVYTPDSVVVALTVPRDRPTGTLVLRGGRLITMRGTEVIEHGDLVVVNRRIAHLGPTGTVPVPPGARVLDLHGKTVMPGLVDLHDHVFPLEGVHRSRVWHAEAMLAFGVLTARDVQAHFTDFLTYEDRRAAGLLRGGRSLSTGPGIPVFSADIIRSLEDARVVVARYADTYRVPYLKEYLLVRRDMRQWLVMAAAERDLNVTSHGSQSLKQMLMNAIDGYGGIEHGIHAAPLYADVRQLLARTGLTLAHTNWRGFEPYFARTLDPTTVARLQAWYPPPIFERVRATLIDPAAQNRAGGDTAVEATRVEYRDNWKKMDATLAALVAAGGRVAVGGHGSNPGLSTHLQLWAYAEGGMPLLEVLRAGTLRGVEALGLQQDLGSLEVGKLADLLVLDRNPLQAIQNTQSLRYVLFNGRLYDATTLNERWPEARATPVPWWRQPG